MRVTSLRILQLEEEFNAPFKEIVKSFDEAGHSLSDTADILEICRKVLTKIVKDMNWPFFPPDRRSLKQLAPDNKGLTPNKAKALEKTRKIRFEKHAIVINGIRDTVAGHARRYNITERAVRYRLEKGIPVQPSPMRSDYASRSNTSMRRSTENIQKTLQNAGTHDQTTG